MNKNIFLAAILLIFSFFLAGCTDQAQEMLIKLQQSAAETQVSPQASFQPQTQPTVKPSIIPEVIIEPSPSVLPVVSDEELIISALCAKHGWIPADIMVTVSKNTGLFASGGVREVASEVGGGYWFSAKVGGNWQIVADGNGTISCADLIAYPDFPVDMIPECWDESTGEIVYR